MNLFCIFKTCNRCFLPSKTMCILILPQVILLQLTRYLTCFYPLQSHNHSIKFLYTGNITLGALNWYESSSHPNLWAQGDILFKKNNLELLYRNFVGSKCKTKRCFFCTIYKLWFVKILLEDTVVIIHSGSSFISVCLWIKQIRFWKVD